MTNTQNLEFHGMFLTNSYNELNKDNAENISLKVLISIHTI